MRTSRGHGLALFGHVGLEPRRAGAVVHAPRGTLRVLDRMLDTNPYVAFGSFMHGCLTRISTEPLVNVTAGGGSTVPTFLVEPR